MEGDDDDDDDIDSTGDRIDDEINLAQEIAERNDEVLLHVASDDNPQLNNTDWSNNKKINKSL